MITIKLQGGLGNQMFQYALAKNLSIKTGLPIKFDLTFLHSRLPGRTYVFREYDVDIFGIQEKTTLLSKVPRMFRNPAYILQKILHIFRNRFDKNFYKEKEQYSFDSKILDIKSSVYLDGYWQNELYFKDIQENIRERFAQFSNPLSHAAMKLLTIIEGTNSVCINFRRTDYVSIKENRELFGSLENTYYQEAIEYIKKRVSEPHLFIFSDDIEWCKKNFASDLPTTFVGHEYAGEKFADYLRLMSACKHDIIPNSTFAWWAAWLNENQEKIVITPKKWTSTNNADGIISKNWIRI